MLLKDNLRSGQLMQRPVVIFITLAIGFAALWYYFDQRPSSGVEPMGDSDTLIVQWVALLTAVVSLFAAIVGLVQKLIELRANSSKDP